MNLKNILSVALFLASASAIAIAARQGALPAAVPSPNLTAQKHAVQQQDEGQRVFHQHCSRCHTAPDGFSPRISGTIVRHMRVRASLSRNEEEELLLYFNP